jgi:ATP-dependent protease ClpP protease subunit
MKSFIMFLVSFFSSASFAKVELSPEKTIVIGGVISNRMFTPTVEAMEKIASKHKEIDIILSSPGGDVITGSLLIDRMEQLKLRGINIRCVVRDVAASMAFQILLHCNERYATPHSFLLWHPVRVFMQSVMTADMAQVLAIQLASADEVALHDIQAYLPMNEADLLWHFKNETLHQAYNLLMTAPGFFKEVTNNITNLYPTEPALDTTALGGFFGINQVIYIHERFMNKENKK